MEKAAITSVGCKVNYYEAQAAAGLLETAGYEIVDFSERADVYVIYTCTVTNTGDKKSRQLIRRANAANPQALIIVAGCYSQLEPGQMLAIDGVKIVLGTSQTSRINEVIEQYKLTGEKQVQVVNLEEERHYDAIQVPKFRERARAYIKIQDGCRQYCSYCIIPYARGPVKSRPANDIRDEMAALSKNGVKEIVLTGIHIASYGYDLDNTGLLDVIHMAEQADGIERIRLSSLEPGIITEEFVSQLSQCAKLCPYFHLSLQSGSESVLKRMNRKYTPEIYRNAVALICRYFDSPAIWTDVIAGFPGENEQDFLEGYEFIRQSGIHRLHVFPFSPKKGTPAAEFDNQLTRQVKAERAAKLRQLSDRLYETYLKEQAGKKEQVLFEKSNGDGFLTGHTRNYILAAARGPGELVNTVQTVKLRSLGGTGEMAAEIVS